MFWIITGVVVVVLVALAWWSSGHRWKVDTRGRNPEGRQAIDRARSESAFRNLGGGPPGGTGMGGF
ncbi:MAG: hypothetical protein ACR2FG_11695 [Marmoricola sp.]